MSTPRTCPTCGAQVSDTERFCANCGSRLPDQPAPPASQPPAASPTIVLRPEGVEPTQVLPAATPPPPQQPSPPQGTPASPYGLPSSPAGPPQGAQAYNLPPSSGAPPATPARRGLPLWVMILLGVLGLCVVACGIGFVGLNIVGQQVGSQTEGVFASIEAGLATVEVEATSEGVGGLVSTREPTAEPADEPTEEPGTTLGSTPEAAPTSSGAGGIVGGIGGAGEAAQTAAAQTAEAVQADAGAEQTAVAATAEIDQIFAGANVVFSDEFVDNRNAWFTGVFEEIEEDRIEDGVFKVIWSDEGSSYELYEVREIPNFIAQVDCLIKVGGVDASCGLVFGQKNDVGFYKFEVFEDYYRLFVVSADADPVMLAEGDPAGIIKPGEPNRLRVIKRGDEIRLFLNDVALDTVSDPTYANGKVGVSTNSYIEGGPAEIWFDNFTVWQLP